MLVACDPALENNVVMFVVAVPKLASMPGIVVATTVPRLALILFNDVCCVPALPSMDVRSFACEEALPINTISSFA